MNVLDGVVRVRLSSGSCGSADADEESLRAMLREAVPDIAEVIVHRGADRNGFVPLLSVNGAASRAG